MSHNDEHTLRLEEVEVMKEVEDVVSSAPQTSRRPVMEPAPRRENAAAATPRRRGSGRPSRASSQAASAGPLEAARMLLRNPPAATASPDAQRQWRNDVDRLLHLAQASPLLQNRPLFQAICPGSLWARDNRWLLSRVQRLAGPAGGQGPFVPVGTTNRDKRTPFCPGWCLQPGQKALAPLSPSLSPRPSHSAHLFSCCSWLGIEEFLLISSPYL